MKRGDVVIVSAPGDFGKPRPAVIIQSDAFNETHDSITVCLLTTTIIAAPIFRLDVQPSPQNGIQRASQIMIDKMLTVRRAKLGEPIGMLDDDTMLRVNRSIAVWLGLGG